jgi:hypothetical protein
VRVAVRRAAALEVGALLAILAAQAFLLARPIHTATDYDEGVYLASVDALRHGQTLGTEVFAPQFPGFYDLLRVIASAVGETVTGIRAGMVVVTLIGTVGGWLIGRRFGGVLGGLLAAAFLVIAPPLDLFGFRVLADPPTISLALAAAGVATLAGPVAALAAGALFAAALSVKLTAVVALPLVAYLLWRRPRHAIAGAAAVGIALLALHAAALPDLWDSAVEYHRKARDTPNVIPHPHRQIVEQIPRRAPFFWLAILAGAVGLVNLALRRPLRVWPLWLCVAASVLFLLWHAPLHDNHLILFPAWLAVAAGATLGAGLPRRPVVYAAAALVVAAGYVQQIRRVDVAKTPEPAPFVAAAGALERLVPPKKLVVDDRPIIAFRGHRRVVGEVVDMSYLRFETGSLTDSEVIRLLRRARAVVVSRSLRTRPEVMRYVRSLFDVRYDRGGVRIYVRDLL